MVNDYATYFDVGRADAVYFSPVNYEGRTFWAWMVRDQQSPGEIVIAFQIDDLLVEFQTDDCDIALIKGNPKFFRLAEAVDIDHYRKCSGVRVIERVREPQAGDGGHHLDLASILVTFGRPSGQAAVAG
ncbi:hypothetical protein D3093_08680 [Azospirillum argentinense]|uniref:Uncharacterized protein n=2 Tax=Azospirillum argentinense TaxID=2970906 RepID=A0A4D8PD90_9PROT|nr:hypothetical protein D3093_08680 [Azospirillum argentinense]